MIKSILSIGLNDKDTKKQEISTNEALRIIGKMCSENSDGVTIIPNCMGVYRHNDGTQVIENSIRCEFYDENIENVKTIAKILCKMLNQESIAFEEVNIYSEFISL